MNLYKKYITKVVLILLGGTLNLFGAEDITHQQRDKLLNLIPISYNQEKREFSVLLTLRKDIDGRKREFTPFPTWVNSFHQLNNAITYMVDFSKFTFNAYSEKLCPDRRSFPFNNNGHLITGTEQQGYMFIEIPFHRGQELTDIAKKRNAYANFVWASISSLLTHQENMPYGVYADDSSLINKQYLRTLKTVLPYLQQNPGEILSAPTQPVPEAPKMLHIIPVSYNPQNNEFHILLTQQHKPLYIVFLAAIDSFANLTRYTEYMPTIAHLTFGAYPADLKPSAIGTYAFDEQGKQVVPHAQEGYLYVEIPFITGRDIWAHLPIQNQYFTNFNWISRDIIMHTTEGSLPRGYRIQIESRLLQTLKATLPLLKKQGDQLILTQYEAEKEAAATGVSQQECPVCMEAKTLKILPCGHKICEECLQTIIKKNPLCPTCRAPIPHK